MTTPSPKRLYNLDYLRGLSAFGIMIYHLVSWGIGPLSQGTFLGRVGVYGVSMFYVLSGLTLFYVYYQRMQPTRSDLRDFFLKRLFRIFPLFWLAVFLTLAVQEKTVKLGLLMANLTGLFSVIRPNAYIPTGGWSIGNELVFYLFFPVFVLLSKRNKPFFWLLAGALFFVFLYFAFYRLNASASLYVQWNVYINPLNQVFLFLAGFLLGYLFNDRQLRPTVPALCLIAGLGLLFFFPGSINVAAGVDRVVFTTVCILICLAFYKTTLRLPRLPDKVLTWLGEASYSVYLMHPIVWFGVQDALTFMGARLEPWAQISISVLLTLAVSYLVYKYYEVFFMKKSKVLRPGVLRVV